MSKKSLFILVTMMNLLSGCASDSQRNYKVDDSYLKQALPKTVVSIETSAEEERQATSGFIELPALSMRDTEQGATVDLASFFSNQEQVEIAADELPLTDFLHYVMGEVLKVNYILGDSAKNANQTVTLNIQQNISKQKLFLLTQNLLAEKGFLIRRSEGVFYINNEATARGTSAIVFGYGQTVESVPKTTSEIIQIVPFKYGLPSSVTFLLPNIVSVKVTPDNQQNSAMLRGKRDDIIKALEFIHLIDSPNHRNQSVAAFKSVFVPVKDLFTELEKLLKNDGYAGGLSSVALEAQSTLILFSADPDLMQRAKFWLEQLDVPADSDEKQYFVFQPQYARASDLTESLAPLLGGAPSSGIGNRTTASNNSGQGDANETKRSGRLSAGNEKISIVVDARSNSLIVNASGKDYRSLLPLIERLDVLPKQVMLEVMIVEVTLKDVFKRGVEFFLNENNFTLGNQDAFGLGDIGGLSYILTGSNKWSVNANLSQDNDLVNIVSRPSLVVRDGVTANLQVGTDIPIVSSTSSPDVGTTTSVQYRKTGLTLNVTPTVNSRGVVIMEIDQVISNIVEGGVTAQGAPSIFNRSMKTEVVANSGQTVILGGLISENKTNSATNVPGFSDIPLLGNLFSVKSDIKDKTELVIMVTPRIIESAQQWEDIKTSMSQQLQQIQILQDGPP